MIKQRDMAFVRDNATIDPIVPIYGLFGSNQSHLLIDKKWVILYLIQIWFIIKIMMLEYNNYIKL